MKSGSPLALIRRWLRNLVPVAMTFAFVLIGQLSLPVPFLNDVAPAFALMSLYFWGVFRPDLMPYAAVFGLGIVHDAISGAPLGLHALVYLLVQALVFNQRRFVAGKPFWVFWCAFAMVVPLAAMATWLLASIARGMLLAPGTTMVSVLLTIAFFPAVAWLLVQAQTHFVGAAEV